MNEKHIEVQQWLDGIFGSDPVPQYEYNQRTTMVLHQLMERSQRQDQAQGLLVEDLRQKATEYGIQADRLGSVLGSVGLTPSCLSQSGTVSLRTLVSMSLMLQTKDASTTSLLLAISEATQAAVKLSDARKLEQKLLSQLLAKTKTALVKNTALHKALSSLVEQSACEGPELEKKAKQAGFLQSKAKEYHKHMQQLQRDLKSCGVDSSIYHSALLRKAEELQQLRDRLHPMKGRLDSYQKLPPDLALARVRVEEAKRELTSLEEELSKQIDIMHM